MSVEGFPPKKPTQTAEEREKAEKLAAAIENAKDRVRQWKQHELELNHRRNRPVKTIENLSEETYLDLIGELRAAESRKRLIFHGVQTTKMKTSRTSHLISLQSNAVEAVRLKNVLQPPPVEKDLHQPIILHSRREMDRVDELVTCDVKQLAQR